MNFQDGIIELTEEETVNTDETYSNDGFEMYLKKYIPQTFEDVILDVSTKEMIETYLSKGTICNLVFAGSAGIGKTTIAKCICSSLDAQYFHVDASLDTGIDMIRGPVRDFCNISVMENKLKIIVFSEADRLSDHAQDALKDLIELEMEDVRFIFTCNRLNKIVKPIRSRCTLITPTFERSDVYRRIVDIIKKEKIIYTPETVNEFFEKVVSREFPDIRSCIKRLENCTISGTLKVVDTAASVDEIACIAEEVRVMHKNPLNTRQWLNQNFKGDYEELACALFNKFSDNISAMVIIGDALKYFPTIVDKEIHFTYIISQLSQLP